jgi:hypothetical protein
MADENCSAEFPLSVKFHLTPYNVLNHNEGKLSMKLFKQNPFVVQAIMWLCG